MVYVVQEAFASLRRDPLRIALTLLGIVIGSASVVFLASTLHASSWALQRSSQQAAGTDIVRVAGRAASPSEAMRWPVDLRQSDALAMAAHATIPASSAVAARTLYHQEATTGRLRKPVGVQSGGTTYAAVSGFELEHGRWMLPEEDGHRVCVIGHDVWKDLYEERWPLDSDALVLNGSTRLRVVGVLARRPPMGGGDGDGTWMVDRRVFVSNGTFRSAIAPIDGFDEVVLRQPVEDGKIPDTTETARELSPLLENLHYGVHNFEFDALSRGMGLDRLISLAIGVILIGCGAVATMVGGVNVMNAQLVSLHERTKEYGIRRALGLSASRLRWQVLAQSLAYALVGSAIGVGVGLGLAMAISAVLSRWLTPWPFTTVGWSIVAAVLSAAVAGIVAGWLPAKRAAELSLVECLRSE